MPRVSVIVPTYNHQGCLVESLRSTLQQTCQDQEIIVVDDGSTDDSAIEVLRRLCPDPDKAEAKWRQRLASGIGPFGFSFWTGGLQLQYIYQINRGMGAARNRGMTASSGEFVAFLEPGFIWDPRFLATQTGFLDESPDAWIAHGRVTPSRSNGKNGRKRARGPVPIGFMDVVAGGELCASAIVARRMCIEAHGGFDENLPSCEDYDLWIRIAAHVPIFHVGESIVHAPRSTSGPGWCMDRYRVYALEKAFQSGHLNAEQRHRVAEELIARCDTLVDGYRQRSNTERANFYERKRKRFEIEVSKLDLSSEGTRPASRSPRSREEVESLSATGRL